VIRTSSSEKFPVSYKYADLVSPGESHSELHTSHGKKWPRTNTVAGYDGVWLSHLQRPHIDRPSRTVCRQRGAVHCHELVNHSSTVIADQSTVPPPPAERSSRNCHRYLTALNASDGIRTLWLVFVRCDLYDTFTTDIQYLLMAVLRKVETVRGRNAPDY